MRIERVAQAARRERLCDVAMRDLRQRMNSGISTLTPLIALSVLALLVTAPLLAVAAIAISDWPSQTGARM